MFNVSVVSQFIHAPFIEHLDEVRRILRYLKSCLGKGLFFKMTNNKRVEVYTDADYAGSATHRKSTSGYYTFVWGNLVTCMEKQKAKFGSA